MRTVEEIQVSIDAVKKSAYCGEEWKKIRIKMLESELVETITSGIPLDRLREICEAEKDGRYVALPCWGRVYIISGGEVQEMDMCHYRGNKARIYDMRCECIDQHEDCEAICANENEKACAYNFRVAEIGKTVFLTRAEAEAAKGEKR